MENWPVQTVTANAPCDVFDPWVRWVRGVKLGSESLSSHAGGGAAGGISGFLEKNRAQRRTWGPEQKKKKIQIFHFSFFFLKEKMEILDFLFFFLEMAISLLLARPWASPWPGPGPAKASLGRPGPANPPCIEFHKIIEILKKSIGILRKSMQNR